VVGESGLVCGPTLRDQLPERWGERTLSRRPVDMCCQLPWLQIERTWRLLLKRLVEVDLALGIHNPDNDRCRPEQSYPLGVA